MTGAPEGLERPDLRERTERTERTEVIERPEWNVPDWFEVPVSGGNLRVARWGRDPEVAHTVIAAHGITANALSWLSLSTRLGEFSVIAPDLRGRAGSAGLPGPFGMKAHVADMVAVLDFLGTDSAIAVGHSMGGFVVASLALAHPDRVTGAVLVDGGYGFALPAGVDTDVVLAAVVGPAIQRLDMVFADETSYVDYWRRHPALIEHWSPALQAYVVHDLVGVSPEMRSSCVLEAVRTDGADILLHDDVRDAVLNLGVSAEMICATQGMLGAPPGLYSRSVLGDLAAKCPTMPIQVIDGVNHYTIITEAAGVDAIGLAVRRLIKQ